MQWRLTLDVPFSFCREPGIAKSVHCQNFRPLNDSHHNTWRDPVTGLVMLKPTLMTRDYANAAIRDLTQFTYAPSAWTPTKKSSDKTDGFTTTFPQGATRGNFMDIMVAASKVVVDEIADASCVTRDSLSWALESKFQLGQDEGFCLHYYVIGDELIRKRNWQYVQWDNIGIHFGYEGVAKVLRYASRSAINTPPELKYEFEFARPGEILKRHSYLFFLPIPTLGLLFYFGSLGIGNILTYSSVDSGAPRGHLIPWDSYRDPGGTAHLFEASPIRIALNPCQHYDIVFNEIKFPASGDYTDAVLDFGYARSQNPTTLEPIALNTLQQTITGTLRKNDNSGAWDPTVPPPPPAKDTRPQGRFKASLITGDTRYTPFLFGYHILWDPLFASRGTTPVIISSYADGSGQILEKLEFSQDEYGRLEGKADMVLQTAAAKKIVERGDATFLIEYRPTVMDAWATVDGGLAKNWEYEVIVDAFGSGYSCSCSLHDLYELLREEHNFIQHAFDGLTPGESINIVLVGCGQARIASLPPELTAEQLPVLADGSQWRLQPREGESGDQIIDKLLIFVRKQYKEWRLRYDWVNSTWVIELKPRDVNTAYTIIPFTGPGGRNTVPLLPNEGSGIYSFRTGKGSPESPEANWVWVEGTTRPDGKGERIASTPIYNPAGLNDTSADSYLGRYKGLRYLVYPITSLGQVNIMARRIAAAVFPRRQKETPIRLQNLHAPLQPSVQVERHDHLGNVVTRGWIKRRSIIIDQFDQEEMDITLDSVWEGKIGV